MGRKSMPIDDITKEREKTKKLPQFSWGYGNCAQQGWVSQENL